MSQETRKDLLNRIRARNKERKANTENIVREIKQKKREPRAHSLPCIHEGAVLEWCNECNGELRHIRDCDIHQRCTRSYVSDLVQACIKCDKYQAQSGEQLKEHMAMTSKQRKRAALAKLLSERKNKQVDRSDEPRINTSREGQGFRAVQDKTAITWEYGITTVEQRRNDLLPKTLESLHNAGFVNPQLFVDGTKDIAGYEKQFGLHVTARTTNIRTFGNWYLALVEMYIRNPHAQRYALFQDDIIACRGLREYLEHTPYPDKGYLNLITYPQNEQYKRLHFKGLPEEEMIGWYPSNQLGKGAQGLVFSRDAVVVLLSHLHMIERPQDERRGWRGVDGGIVTAFKKAGWQEYVHSPSLLRHTGELTTMGNHQQPIDLSFRGEQWDAMSLVRGESKPDVKIPLPVIVKEESTIKEEEGAPMVKKMVTVETTGTDEKD